MPRRACSGSAATPIWGALKDYSKAIRFDTNRPRSWYERAQARGKLKDWDGALKDVSKALSLNPRYVASWFARAKIYAMQKRWSEAMRDCGQVIHLDPTVAEAWALLGEAKIMTRDWDGALPDLQEASRLDPRSPWPYYYRGKAKYIRGLYSETAAEMRAALQVHPGHEECQALLQKAEGHDASLKLWKVPRLKTATPRRRGQDWLLPALPGPEIQPPLPPPVRSPSSPAILGERKGSNS